MGSYRRDNSYHLWLVRAGQLSDIGKNTQREQEREESAKQQKQAAKQKQEARRQAKSERNSSSSSRSGGFHMYADMPKRGFGNSSIHWQASCDEGGNGVVSIQDSTPNIYCWESNDKDSSQGCEAAIGAEAAMRKACQ